MLSSPILSPAGTSPLGPAQARLVQAAMRLFGERGTSVSMLEIGAAAGHRNKSAIAYHFASKAGLIQAVYQDILGFLAPRFESGLLELEGRPATKLSLYEIGLELNAPFFALYALKPGGEDAIRALARLGYETQGQMQSLYLHFLPAIFGRFAALIHKKVPRKPHEQIRLHLTHYVLATVNGLAHTGRWDNVNVRTDPDQLFELMLSYTDYVGGGLGGAASDRPAIDKARWRAAVWSP